MNQAADSRSTASDRPPAACRHRGHAGLASGCQVAAARCRRRGWVRGTRSSGQCQTSGSARDTYCCTARSVPHSTDGGLRRAGKNRCVDTDNPGTPRRRWNSRQRPVSSATPAQAARVSSWSISRFEERDQPHRASVRPGPSAHRVSAEFAPLRPPSRSPAGPRNVALRSLGGPRVGDLACPWAGGARLRLSVRSIRLTRTAPPQAMFRPLVG